MLFSKSTRFLAIAFVGALAACGGGGEKKPVETGDLAINVAAITTPPQTVLVRIYGPVPYQPGAPGSINTIIAAQEIVGTGTFRATFLSIPAGTYKLHAKGYDAFDVLPGDYDTAAPVWESAANDPNVTVTGGNTTNASLFMQEVGVVNVSNNAPWVSLLSADVSSVYSATNGGQSTSASITAQLQDADGDLTDYLWSDDVSGSFSIPSAPVSGGTANIATTWTPPNGYEGPAHLYLEVFDSIHNASRVFMTMTVIMTPGYGTVIVDVAFNSNPIMAAPLVANYFVDGTTGAILGGGGQLAPGDKTLLSVEAWDPNGDPVAFNFTSDCGNLFANQILTGSGTSGDPYFVTVEYTVPATTAVNTTCTVTADILDLDATQPGNPPKGGELIINLGIHVGLP